MTISPMKKPTTTCPHCGEEITFYAPNVPDGSVKIRTDNGVGVMPLSEIPPKKGNELPVDGREGGSY